MQRVVIQISGAGGLVGEVVEEAAFGDVDSGNTLPSSAGFYTTEFLFTDDNGTYLLPTRDMAAVTPADGQAYLAGYLVADMAQHKLLTLCCVVQKGFCIYDDVNNRPIPGMEKFAGLVDVEHPYPLAYAKQDALTEWLTSGRGCVR